MRIRITQLMGVVLVLTIIVCISSAREQFGKAGIKQCPNLDRQKFLEKLDSILKNSLPGYAQYPSSGFFVFDLNDPANKYIPAKYVQADDSICFIDNHVYHFAPIEFIFSESHIAVLEDGHLQVFKSINCKDSTEHLPDVLTYVKKRLKKDPDIEKLLTRVSDYRKYGYYMNIDSPRVPCEVSEKQPTP